MERRHWVTRVRLLADVARACQRKEGLLDWEVARRLGKSPSQLSIVKRLRAGLKRHPELAQSPTQRDAYARLLGLHRRKRCGCRLRR